ncbi:MAG: hypothetical protein CVV44_11395 [Spirochaetae bacterium HGW-Spirochaetae-1]|jgi:hypothetical protein|nr:MAG: hypothetical protein CVV44_11395 [Spirochaetae bacterium HGW-Spirochaetae-1]
MARSTKHAALICSIATVLTLAGIAAGIYFKMPVIVIAGLLPAVVYEAYRTEGVSTIWASWGMLIVLVIEAVFIIKKININIADLASKYIPGLPALDIKLGAPVVMAWFCYILIRRTAGIYTKWLAVVILIGALGLFYALDPSLFNKFAGEGLREGLNRIPVK